MAVGWAHELWSHSSWNPSLVGAGVQDKPLKGWQWLILSHRAAQILSSKSQSFQDLAQIFSSLGESSSPVDVLSGMAEHMECAHLKPWGGPPPAQITQHWARVQLTRISSPAKIVPGFNPEAAVLGDSSENWVQGHKVLFQEVWAINSSARPGYNTAEVGESLINPSEIKMN